MRHGDWSELASIYIEVGRFFAEIEKSLGKELPFYGFKILNAPPVRTPDFFFVG